MFLNYRCVLDNFNYLAKYQSLKNTMSGAWSNAPDIMGKASKRREGGLGKNTSTVI